MINFFIFGLPRSRTAWFANLLTTDRTLCLHHALVYISAKKLREIFESEEVLVGGCAGPNPEKYNEAIDEFPNARIVVLNSTVDDSLESSLKMFRSVPINEEALHDIILKQHEVLQSIIEKNKDILVKDARNLNDCDVEEIWQYCMPGIPINRMRLSLLKNMNVQVNMIKAGIGEFLSNTSAYLKEY